MKKVCPNCGKPVKDTDKNCGNCGYPLKRAGNKRLSNNKKHVKTIMWGCIGIILVIILGGGYYSFHQYSKGQHSRVTTEANQKSDDEKASSEIMSKKRNRQTENSSKSGWKQGIPTELVGDYTAYESGHAIASLQFGKAVENIESDGSYFTYYLRKSNTRYYSNDVKYKRLDNGTYLLDYLATVTVNGKDEGKVHKTEKFVVNSRSFSFIGLTFDKEIYSWIAPNSEADDVRKEKPFPNADSQDNQPSVKNDTGNSEEETKNKNNINDSATDKENTALNNEANKTSSDSQTTTKAN